MKFLIGILTSDDTAKLERAIKSVEGDVDILVVANSLDTSYAEKAKEVADRYGCQFIETVSNGTPGRGKQSVLDIFCQSEYDYLIPIDGDDYLSTDGIQRITDIVNQETCDVLGNIGQHMADGKNVVEDLFMNDMFAYKKWSVAELRSWVRFSKTISKFNLPAMMIRFICLSKKAAQSFRYRDDLQGSEDMYAACELYSNPELKFHTTSDEIYIYDFDNGGAFWKFYSNKQEIDRTAELLEKLYESRS